MLIQVAEVLSSGFTGSAGAKGTIGFTGSRGTLEYTGITCRFLKGVSGWYLTVT